MTIRNERSHPLELRDLEAFVRIADRNSFTRAAEELSLTQPAVTRQIAGLERELHTRLLERLGRRVELTVDGEALYPYAAEMLRLAKEARRAVAEVASGSTGRLALGASSTAATYLLPPLLYRFRAAFPGVDLSVQTGVSSEIQERVKTNAVDIGIVTEARQHDRLNVVHVADSSIVVVAYPHHPLAERLGNRSVSKEAVSVEELARSPLILMQKGTNLRATAERLLSSAKEGRIAMELDSVEAIKKMVEARLGISLLPLVAVAEEVAAGRLVALPLADGLAEERRIVALYREDKYLSAALKGFIDLMKPDSSAR